MPPALRTPSPSGSCCTAALAGPRLRLRCARSCGSRAIALRLVPDRLPGRPSGRPTASDGQPGKIQLGPRPAGGIHLVLQVVTDDALNATIDDAVQTARDQATRKGSSSARASA